MKCLRLLLLLHADKNRREMANAFQKQQARDPHIPEVEQEAIIQEGLRLFSVHFRSLWL